MSRRSLLNVLAALAAGACGGGGGGGTTGPPTLTAVTVAGDSTVVLAGTTTLTATALAGTTPVTSGVTFAWSSSDPTVATVSSTGVVTGVARGTVSITVRANTASQPSGPTATKSIRARIGSITVAPAAPSMASLGETVTLSAQARDASNAAVPGVTFTWSSASMAVATVDAATGVVTAMSNGTAQITAAATGENLSASVTATVQQVAVTLDIVQTDTTVDRINASFTPTVSAKDARNNSISGAGVSWTSRITAVATVNTSGVVTSVNEGSTYVVASSGSVKDSVLFNVTLVYGSVDIVSGSPPTPATQVFVNKLNGTLQMMAQVKDVGGTTVPSPQLSWSLTTTSTGVASINSSTGVVTGTATGDDSVVVTARTVKDTVRLTVRQLAGTITVSSSKSVLNYVGQTQQFRASATDSGGSAIPPGTKTFTWSSGNSVLTVDQTGLATATGATSITGVNVSVSASVDGVTGSSAILVRQFPNSAALSPANFSTLRAIGQTVSAACVVKDSGGAAIPNHPCNWTFDTPNVISFSPSSAASTTVTAVGNGSSGITATAATNVIAQNFITVLQVAKQIVITGGNNQTGLVGSTLPTAYSVTVEDSLGHAVSNTITPVAVTWAVPSGQGSVNPTSSNSDVNGVATTTRILGPNPGSQTATATSSPVLTGSPLMFTATATTPAPATASVNVGDIFFRSVRNSTQNPAVDTVAVNGTVTWTWVGSLTHSVFSTGTPSFTSSALKTGIGNSYLFTFTIAGTYTYECGFHGSLMTGRIVVQ